MFYWKYNGLLEIPDVYLSDANKNYIYNGVISVFDLKTELAVNGISKITFSIHKYLNHKKVPYYDLIDFSRLVCIMGIGWFQINNIEKNGTGINETLSITALSLENELCTKKLTSFGQMGTEDDWDGGLDRYCLYNVNDVNHSILHIVTQKVPSWKVGYVDPNIDTGYRSFNEDEIDAYTFLTKNVSETFECIFVFDTFNQTINVYSYQNLGKTTSIYLSYENLVKEIEIQSNLSDIKTVLSVNGGTYGSGTLGIIEVNPSGTNTIFDFTYFYPFMTEKLRNKMKEYEEKYDRIKETFQNNITKLQALYDEYNNLLNKEVEIDVEFFNSQLKAIQDQIDTTTDNNLKIILQQKYQQVLEEKEKYLKDIDSYVYTRWDEYGLTRLQELYDSFSGVCAQYLGKVNSDQQAKEIYDTYYQYLFGKYDGDSNCVNYELQKRKNELENKTKEIESQKLLCETSTIKLDEFLGDELYKELSRYVHEDSFSDDSFLVTDIMTDSEKIEMQQELLKQSTKKLSELAHPQYTITINSKNFLNIPAFRQFAEQLYLGDIITIETDYGETTSLRLLKITIDWENLNNFELTFSSKNKLEDGLVEFEEIVNQAQSSASTLNLHGLGWNYATNKTSEVHEFINSSLNASLNKLINSIKEEVTMDNTGIRCRKWDDDRNDYDPRQIWLTSNQIAFSADGFRNVSMALGEIEINGNNVYGLVADAIVGKLVATENLLITNGKGNVTIDGEKAKFENCEITVTNGTNTIKLDPSGTLEIKKGAEKQLYFENGNLTITGTMKSGKIESSNFTSGSISIGGTTSSPAFAVDNNGNISITKGSIKIGGTSSSPVFSVDSSGHVIANSIKLGSGSVTNDSLASDVSNKIQGAYDGVAENAQDLQKTLNALSSTGIVTISGGTITAGKIYASMIAAGTLAGFNIISYGTSSNTITINNGEIKVGDGNNNIGTISGNTIFFNQNISGVTTSAQLSGIGMLVLTDRVDTTTITGGRINCSSVNCSYINPDSHKHSDYALSSHTHTQYALSSHTHSQYASSSHTHHSSTIPTTASFDGIDSLGLSIGYLQFSGAKAAGSSYTRQIAARVASINTSDFRLKRDFRRIKGIENTYLSLKPYDYRFKSQSEFYNQKIHSGLLGQEVIKALEKNGLDWRDYDLIETFKPDGEISDEGQYVGEQGYRVNYNNLHAWHIYMIQELWKKVESLEKETEYYKRIVQSMSHN